MSIRLITHPSYSYTFPSKHRFPMNKFKLLHDYLKAQGLATAQNISLPGTALDALLETAHCPNYLRGFRDNTLSPQAQRRIGLPWSEGLVKRTFISPNGTFLTANFALSHGVACHLAGGTHHAHRDYGSGYCIINDLSVTALGLIARARHRQQRPPRILIFDCDVHQGDGTATTCAHEPLAFTCSLHCDKNFPARKAQSDLDIHVNVGTEDEAYLRTLKQGFQRALELAKPDLLLYDAGVDVYQHDPLGLLNISLQGIRERDEWVLQQCKQLGLPVATVIGGGYDRDQQALAQRHAIVVESAFKVFAPAHSASAPVAKVGKSRLSG